MLGAPGRVGSMKEICGNDGSVLYLDCVGHII